MTLYIFNFFFLLLEHPDSTLSATESPNSDELLAKKQHNLILKNRKFYTVLICTNCPIF